MHKLHPFSHRFPVTKHALYPEPALLPEQKLSVEERSPLSALYLFPSSPLYRLYVQFHLSSIVSSVNPSWKLSRVPTSSSGSRN